MDTMIIVIVVFEFLVLLVNRSVRPKNRELSKKCLPTTSWTILKTFDLKQMREKMLVNAIITFALCLACEITFLHSQDLPE